MTMNPLVFHLGPIEIAGFGIAMMLAFVIGGAMMASESRRLGFSDAYASDLVMGGVVGGIVGAKLWYVALTGDPGALFSRAGLVFYGGFFGAVLTVTLNGRRRRVPIRWTMHLVAPALAAGYAIGRVGCLLANDDYGRPTDLPWGIKFPNGAPPSTVANLSRQFGVEFPPGTDPNLVVAVHPTQIYEATIMGLAAWWLWRRRTAAAPVGHLFGWYLVIAGLERFGIEILRAKDDRLLGPFTLAQLTSVLLVTVGIAILQSWRAQPSVAPGAYLAGNAAAGTRAVSAAAGGAAS
jgi:phosphatidylglycerol:prolipoprotein diacylglycerol transferase